MEILIIEDDLFKQELITKELKDIHSDSFLFTGRSVHQAVELVRKKTYDFIVLDIALPSHDSRPGAAQPISQPSGGIEILLELAYEERPDKVVIVTQYPEIEYDGKLYPLSSFAIAVSDSLTTNIIDVIFFNAQEKQWRTKLREAIK